MPLVLKDNYRSKTLVSDIETLLDHIINIFKSSKLDLKHVEEQVRLEKFHHYDRSLINKTMKDPRMFTLNNGGIYPTKLHSYVFEDNFDIYENRFVVSLLLEIKKDLINTLKYDALKLSFLKSGISYGPYGTNKIMKQYALDTLDLTKIQNFETDLLGKINYLMDQDFYKHISKISLNDINVTNVLLEDINYNACYMFYKKGQERNNAFKKQIIEELKTSLINEYKIKEENNSLSFKINDYQYILSFGDDLYLSISNGSEVKYKLDFQIGLFNSYLLIKLDESQSKIMIEDVNDIKEILTSLMTEFKRSDDTCPICHHTMNDDYCSSCHAKYRSISDNKLWLTNIFELKEDI